MVHITRDHNHDRVECVCEVNDPTVARYCVVQALTVALAVHSSLPSRREATESSA